MIRCIANREPYEEKLIPEPDCVYLKTADGHMVFGNTTYQRVFVAGMSPSGRHAVSFLPKSLLNVSQHSDGMVLSGCCVVQYDHIGLDSSGRMLKFRTLKRSLIGVGAPHIAILGITRVLDVVEDPQINLAAELCEKWKLFQALSDQDRNIAISIAKGLSTPTIADELHVSRKTIENHRTAVLEAMQVETPVDLIKLLVRLHDNGFGDLGL
ncbi:MAG: helix-turn-helix transcriptional regulator [Pirellulaceae bacterium]